MKIILKIAEILQIQNFMKSESENRKKAQVEEKLDENLLYNSELLAEINSKSDEIVESNDYVNEFFLYYIVPFIEKNSQLNNKDERSIIFQNNSGHYLKSIFRIVYSFLIIMFHLISLPLYVLLRFRVLDNNPLEVNFLAVIRSPAAHSKMAFLKNKGVVFYTDSLVYQATEINLSLYSQSLFTRLIGVSVIPWMGFKDYFSLFAMANRHLGFVSAANVVGYYCKRFAHKATFEFYLNKLLKKSKPGIFYTGNKEDRFALIEKRLCNKDNIKTVCIPHGLEYAFKMPAGLVGDIFYCNSQYAKDYLEKLHGNGKTRFVFDGDVVRQMLSKHVKIQKEKQVIFFPESRESKKNLEIIKFLRAKNVKFCVKLHIKDNLDNYRPFIDESVLINDFDEAISNSICLARKSTVLLEAIYNHSIPVAVLVDDKDRAYFNFMFPALNDEGIRKVHSFKELQNLLEKRLKDNNV
jgi:hypothetical protein